MKSGEDGNKEAKDNHEDKMVRTLNTFINTRKMFSKN